MLGEIEDKINETECILSKRGYNYERVEPREFFDYMKGPTPSGDKITLRDVLDSRYLMVHELVEMSELKKRDIPLKKDTVMDFNPAVYEAHMTAFDFELSLAFEEDNRDWVDQRIKLVNSWLEDELMPPQLASVCHRLKKKFGEKLDGG